MTYEAKKLMEQISGVKFCWTKYMKLNFRGNLSKPIEELEEVNESDAKEARKI